MARIWPSDVPFAQNAEGAVLPQSYRPPAVSKVEAGPDILRRRVGPRSVTIPWKSIPITEEQRARLELFFTEELIDGTLSFDMPVYLPAKGYVTRRCQVEGGLWDTDQSNYPLYFVSFNLSIFNL